VWRLSAPSALWNVYNLLRSRLVADAHLAMARWTIRAVSYPGAARRWDVPLLAQTSVASFPGTRHRKTLNIKVSSVFFLWQILKYCIPIVGSDRDLLWRIYPKRSSFPDYFLEPGPLISGGSYWSGPPPFPEALPPRDFHSFRLDERG
jgi:hypothetical protein